MKRVVLLLSWAAAASLAGADKEMHREIVVMVKTLPELYEFKDAATAVPFSLKHDGQTCRLVADFPMLRANVLCGSDQAGIGGNLVKTKYPESFILLWDAEDSKTLAEERQEMEAFLEKQKASKKH